MKDSHLKKDIIIEDLNGIVDNKYLAVSVVAKRARRLNQGSMPLIKTNALKETTIALQELVAKKLEYVELKRPVETKLDASSVFNIENNDEDEIEEEFNNMQYVDDSDFVEQVDEENMEEGL